MSRRNWDAASGLVDVDDHLCGIAASVDLSILGFFTDVTRYIRWYNHCLISLQLNPPRVPEEAYVTESGLRMLPTDWAELRRLQAFLAAVRSFNLPLIALQHVESYTLLECSSGTLPSLDQLEDELAQRTSVLYQFAYESYGLVWTKRAGNGSRETQCPEFCLTFSTTGTEVHAN